MASINNNDYLKIGDVARLVGISPTVIRMWESLGLARPRRTASQYRLYTREDVRLLKRASFLRKVRGMNAPAIVQTLKREGLVTPVRDGAAGAIGARLRQLRLKNGSSLALVAKAIGVSVGFLCVARNTTSNLETVSTSKVPCRTSGKIPGGRTPFCCG